MQKSYVVRTTINLVDFEFYIRSGDILVHDPSNSNRLTVYRNGDIVKVVKQTPLGILAMLKNKFIEEVSNTPTVLPKPKVAIQAKSKSEFKRLTALGAEVTPPPAEEKVCPFGYDKKNPGTRHTCAIHNEADYPEPKTQPVAVPSTPASTDLAKSKVV